MDPAENDHKTIPEKRNRKMKITKSKLKQIIKEEFEEITEGAFHGASYRDHVDGAVEVFREFVKNVGNVPMAIEAMEMAFQAAQGKPYISESQDSTVDEGLENITPENLEILAKAAHHFATQPAVVMALAAGGLGAAIMKIKELMETGE